MPRHVSESWSEYLGPGALTSFALALGTVVAGLGIPFVWRLREVLANARRDERRPADAIMVLGRTLENDRPSRVFRERLDHGAELWLQEVAPRIIVTGGLTGRSTRTEAVAGREYLVARGVPEASVVVEDGSRHTLENLANVRQTLREEGWEELVIVSDPLHLARISALARGLGLSFHCSPAPKAAPRGWRWCYRACRESFLLHWYHVGMTYSRLVGSETLLSRVT